MEDLKHYIVEFKKDETMKSKVYPDNCIVEDLNQQIDIIITYNNYIFSANDSIR